METKQINKLCRDGGNGRNVYITFELGSRFRVVAARSRKGSQQVKLLGSGNWITVGNLKIEESL